MSGHFQVRSFFYHRAFQVRVPGLLLPHLPGAEGGREGREHQGDPAEAHGGPHQKVPSSQQSGRSFSFCVKSETESYALLSHQIFATLNKYLKTSYSETENMPVEHVRCFQVGKISRC